MLDTNIMEAKHLKVTTRIPSPSGYIGRYNTTGAGLSKTKGTRSGNQN